MSDVNDFTWQILGSHMHSVHIFPNFKGMSCEGACEIHFEKCAKCACVRLVFGRAMCDHTFAHLLEQNGQEMAIFCLHNYFRSSFPVLEHLFLL